MLKKITERIFPFLIALSALSVSASAAFYSITGLSKLFAGASKEVIVMAASLEIAKLIIVSLLYQYRKTIPKALKYYLTTAAFVLIMITSMGIYGFLSSAYQQTANTMGNIDAQIELIETKKTNIEKQLVVYTNEKTNIDQSVTSLRGGLSNNITQYKDAKTGQILSTSSSANRKALEKQLDQALGRQENVDAKIDDLNTKIFEYESQIVEIKTGSNTANELGPLKYLQGLTGIPMDKIINWLLLIIIFVFDPLAIALVIAANFAFAQLKEKYKQNIYGETVPKTKLTSDKLEKMEKQLDSALKEEEKRVWDKVAELREEGLLPDYPIEEEDPSANSEYREKEHQEELISEIMEEDEEDGLYDDEEQIHKDFEAIVDEGIDSYVEDQKHKKNGPKKSLWRKYRNKGDNDLIKTY